MRATMVLLVCALGSVTASLAQKPPEDSASTVSGRVFCSDTNAPARMASVVLEPVEVANAVKPGQERHYSFHGEKVQTQLDGSFVIRHVEPGTYYVVASQPGYLFPLAALYDEPSGSTTAPTDPAKKPAVSAPRITVQPGLSVSVNVTLERGGSVGGNVLFDDGSPASGLNVSVLARNKKGDWGAMPSSGLPIGGTSTSSTTDDQGNYRIAGLSPGKYMVELTLNRSTVTFHFDEHGGGTSSSSGGDTLSVYSGSKARQSEAVPFTLVAGEDRHGEDIQIPLSKLHTVRGSILAARDGHVLNSGSIRLLFADDKSLLSFAGVSREDQEFIFTYVLEGDYLLHVDNAADVDFIDKPNPPNSTPAVTTEERIVHNYGSAEQIIHVTGDLAGIVISVPDAQQIPNPPKP